MHFKFIFFYGLNLQASLDLWYHSFEFPWPLRFIVQRWCQQFPDHFFLGHRSGPAGLQQQTNLILGPLNLCRQVIPQFFLLILIYQPFKSVLRHPIQVNSRQGRFPRLYFHHLCYRFCVYPKVSKFTWSITLII